MKLSQAKSIFITVKPCLLSRGSQPFITVRYNPSRGRRRKLSMSLYNYHGPKPCLLASGQGPTFFTVRSQAHLIGRGRKLPELYISRSKPCLLSRGLWPSITVQSQPTFWRRRRSYFCSFLSSSLPITSALLIRSRTL